MIYIYIHVSFDTTMLGSAHTDNMHVCMYASLDHVCVSLFIIADYSSTNTDETMQDTDDHTYVYIEKFN